MINLLAIIPTTILLGSTNFAIIDIVMLIVLLIAFIIGISRGFLKQVLSLLGLVAGIIIAVIFCDDIVAIINTNAPSISQSIENIIAQSDAFKDLTKPFTSEQEIINVLQNSSIPAFLHGTIAKAIVESGFELQIVKVFATWALYVIVFVVTVLVSLILFAIVKKILYSLTKIKLIGFIDKILGVAFSVAVALVNMMIVVTILSLFIDMNAFIVPNGVDSYFNMIMTKVLEFDFIQNLLGNLI